MGTFELYLTHGRHDSAQDMDDWGFDGPRLQNVVGLHQTYSDDIKVVFKDRDSMLAAQRLTDWEEYDDRQLAMPRYDDMVLVRYEGKQVFFGDWGLWHKEDKA